MIEVAKESIDEFISLLEEVRNSCLDEFDTLVSEVISTFEGGGKLLICGNGGSAADAQHLAAEFVSSFSFGLARKSLPAIALTVDTSVITAIANDFNFDLIFARQIEGIGKQGDSLLAISTSGESKNCLVAVETAKQLGMRTLAFTRKNSSLHRSSDSAIGIPHTNTQHIQECHLILYHCLAQVVDSHFLRKKN